MDDIEIRKKINEINSSSRKMAKPEKCFICGECKSSFCNSHSVPRMSLCPISSDGIVIHASSLMDFDETFVDLKGGINKSGTFNIICNECDGKYFQKYENENNLTNHLSDELLAEIAVKNFLLQINKRMIELKKYEIVQEKFNVFVNLEELTEIQKIDYDEYLAELNFHKSIKENKKEEQYQVLVHMVLPYTVPIATQSAVALSYDMNGDIINNIYETDSSIRMQYLHICILPLTNKSIVLVFYHKRDKLYKSLRHQINTVSKDQILSFINYVIFAYTENYYISPLKINEIKKHQKLIELCQEYNGIPNLGYVDFDYIVGNYKPIKENEIPNLLDISWSLNLE